MKEPKQIVYQYDGNPNDQEAEVDIVGDFRIPPEGAILTRRGKQWRVAHVNIQQELAPGALPAYLIYLTATLQ